MNKAKLKYPWAFEKEPKEEKATYLTIQEVVDMSNFFLKIHSCILYGLIEGELPNQERCLHYLEMGKRHGIKPNEDYIPEGFFNHYKQVKK